ncbi:MAG: hypothetical protein K6B46_05055 [Opitutales bacterium]|nr:hypothetical protein [Opitutales bacterium]
MFKTLKIFFVAALAATVFSSAVFAQQSRGNASSAKAHGIIVRASYWQDARSKNQEALFYKDGRDYLPFMITQMAFLKAYAYSGPLPMMLYRKATAEEIEKRKEEGVPKSDLEYIEYAKIPLREGMKEVGVLIPGDIRTATPAIFDFSESAFPQGSLLFVNMSSKTIRGNIDLADRNDPDCGKYEMQNFEISPRGLARSREVSGRAILEVKLATLLENVWKMTYSSQLILNPEMRSVVFIIPKKDKKGNDRLDIQSASVAPLPKKLVERPAEDAQEAEAKPGKRDRKSEKPQPVEKSPKRQRRRV